MKISVEDHGNLHNKSAYDGFEKIKITQILVPENIGRKIIKKPIMILTCK
jgi:hypothetical protein